MDWQSKVFLVAAAVWYVSEIYILAMAAVGHPKYCDEAIVLRMIAGPLGLL